MEKRKTKEKIKEKNKDEQILDLIGRQNFVDKIKKLVKISSPNKSWSIAIDGAWGSGKTFVMNMLEKQLKEEPANIVIYYDAWSNDFYEDPLIAILYNILDVFEHLEGIKKDVLQGIKNGINAFLSILSAVPNVDKVIKAGKKAFKEATNEREKKTDDEKLSGYKCYSDFLKGTQKFIKDAIKENKLIILVDELDRCEIDYAMKVLNRLHHLLKIPNVFTITAFNKDILIKNLPSSYGQNDKNEIFTKFFDLIYKLPYGKLKFLEIKANDYIYDYKTQDFDDDIFYTFCNIFLHQKKPREIMQVFMKLSFLYKNFNKEDLSFPLMMIYTIIGLSIIDDNSLNHDFFNKQNFNYSKLRVVIGDFNLLSQSITNSINKYKKNVKKFNYNQIHIYNIPIIEDKNIIEIVYGLTYTIFEKDDEIYSKIHNFYFYKNDKNEIKKLFNCIDKYWDLLDLLKE